MKTNQRFNWAVSVLDIAPSDNVLELGCGVGFAVSLIAPLLEKGTITAIDKSDSMVQKAMERNRAFIKTKKAQVLKRALLALKPGPQGYNKIFAFNVNVFWTTSAAKELAIIRQHLARKGTLYLFYQPPSTGGMKRICETVRQNLAQEQFKVKEILFEESPAIASCCIVASL
ncbi:class I SAM-dependent methyltransferase [Fulvivirgaceae bacterium PWU4]|uniref:Class I SAM-dependent methyltransferase n=1 Tax=Chryseosolibacter histidini TaxID=2782349 RepID=A0AAP2DUY5_9BACT|nr:class I SAM-dependent methyltransferase [Chryseosolibacter histidini]MBT1701457.1 class I SAM-dependent methyltransferase [Chryseosolibacter histidini]